jgi:capsular polysaccharide transport system permease protein
MQFDLSRQDCRLRAGLALQVRVIIALILRETRATYGTSQIGYLWEIITPAAGTAVLVGIFTAINRHPPFGESFALFFATGLLTLGLFRKLGTSLMGVYDANKALMTYPPIKGTDVLFARFLLIAATQLVIMVVFYSGLGYFGLAGAPAYPEKLINAFAVTCLLGFGFGATSAAVLSYVESWRQIVTILTRPLMFISAIFYVPSYMPPEIVDWLKWNPVLHCVEWMRNGYYANYDSRVLDQTYVLTVAVILTLVGLLGERLTRQQRGGA